ncbi:Crp/Fnr family transcriptional regulator [Rhodobacteraceae bacterium N5(2021)]|uniref:Crp/Fnr family transcriptional regulator n=1 Tax=Gymnodinialimonas phycosphaerae TaxID=2841589 RepID=A0A975TZF1_9RHOB|nr:Crp/Fnr family transcriptional regulator [Gymnodinialimonas phycosphaerae]MBY4892889.1 Crp/Fnr family transcriptional regulator [Gymnodinialimonas phycosphaerae]
MSETEDWTQRFTGLSRLPDHVRNVLLRDGKILRSKKGDQIFGAGHVPQNLLFLLSGTVRVSQTSEGGREIVLYRVEAGQSCVMTTACMLAHEAYLAEGVAETDVTAIALPKATFDALVSAEPIFRDFILAAYAHRMTGLFKIIEDVAFGRIDMRLAARLLDLAGTSETVSATHQALATELGTAREVVSRQLHEFQRRGWLEQQRGLVRILDRDALQDLANG